MLQKYSSDAIKYTSDVQKSLQKDIINPVVDTVGKQQKYVILEKY